MNKKLEIYTDGSSLGNPGPGGFGFVVVLNNKIIYEDGGGSIDTTNNKMELGAVILALGYISKLDDKTEVDFYVDSSYVLGGINSWIINWKKNGWKTANKKPVLNKDLWLQLDDLLSKNNKTISWYKIKGHSNHIYNDYVDNIATTYASKQKGN